MKMMKEHISLSLPEKLRYHNQFVLGPRFTGELSSWKRVKIGSTFCLSAHPDLAACQVYSGNKSLTLIGFILDPDDPDADDALILQRLIQDLSESDTFYQQTFGYGGRWILIVDDGEKVTLFNDAAGLRQVYYTDTGFTNELWCASQPGIIADMLEFEMDRDAIDFIDSYDFRKNPEFRWTGDSSPYREIRHMLPNHCLELRDGRCRRYWPDRPLEQLPLDTVVERVSATLRGLMKSASNRFDLALSTTAGLDSRLVLAAAREIRDKVSYMTVRQIGMPDDHADIAVPSQLFSQLGLRHEVVKSSFLMDEEFVRIFRKNVPVAHTIYAPDAYAILNHYEQQKVVATGSASEIARSSFRAQLNKSLEQTITAEDLAAVQGMANNPFAVKNFTKWLSDTGEIYNLDILDLFEWEQGHGNWLAMCQMEFDIAWKDIFTPYNCRQLLITMLSADPSYRKPPQYELFKRLIAGLWPELLNSPINPHYEKKVSAGSALRSGVSAIVPDFIKRSIRKANIF